MSTPQQWELGGEILDKGTEHPSLKIITDSWTSVLEKLDEVRKTSERLKRVGVGRTEDGTLIVARLVPSLRGHAEEILAVAKQLEERLGGA